MQVRRVHRAAKRAFYELTCLAALSMCMATTSQSGEHTLRETYSYSPTLLNPNPRCPEFIQARRFNGGGLGSSFSQFNNLVSIASAHNVTIKARFSTSGHGVNASLVDDFFFGDFFDQKSTESSGFEQNSLDKPPKIINCSTVNEFSMLLAKNRANGCDNATPTLYSIDTTFHGQSHPDMRLYRDAFAHREAYRTSYVAGQGQPTQAFETAEPGAPTRPCTRVAVHIRRGDVVRHTKLHDIDSAGTMSYRKRWVPNRAYLHVIDSVHRALSTQSDHHARTRSPRDVSITTRQHSSTAGGPERISCRLCIELFVEGATSASAVPDADLENTQGHTNFRDRLAEYGTVNIITSDALSSFAQACSSDILITGISAYSGLMALLCDSPLILAWASSNLPNAVTIDKVGRDKTWIDGASLNETAFMTLVEHKGLACKSGDYVKKRVSNG